ncbi:MAG: serine hydrolase [Pseudomonadota bacterium]
MADELAARLSTIVHFPSDDVWQLQDAGSGGWDRSHLDDIVAWAKENNTAQLVILQDGRRLVDESIEPGPVDVFAVQKGLFSLLVAIAEQRCLLNRNDCMADLIGAGWTNLPPALERQVTIRHILTMTTGMADDLSAFGDIGDSYRYNNVAYNYLKQMLCSLAGCSLNELTTGWLTEALGMRHTRWLDRETLLPNGSAVTGLFSTAQDLARLGLLVLNEGLWAGAKILTNSWLSEMVEPGSQDNPAWGYLWWNNNQTSFRMPMNETRRLDGPPIPGAPPDLVMTRGAQGNHLAVLPSLNLVVARTALSPTAPTFERELWQRLLASRI